MELDEAVSFTLTFDVDFKSIGDSEAFKRDVIQDVATAAKIDAKHVKVTALRAGSVIVDMLIAKEAGDVKAIVKDLEEQVKSPNSLLRQGKLTSKTKGGEEKKEKEDNTKKEDEEKVKKVNTVNKSSCLQTLFMEGCEHDKM